MSQHSAQPADSLLNTGFVLMNVAGFFGLGSIPIFYDLYGYMAGKGVDSQLLGTIIGIFSIPPLVLRPLVGNLLDLRRAVKCLPLAQLAMAVVIAAFGFVRSAEAFAILRCLHGLAFLALLTAYTQLLVEFSPPSKATKAISIAAMVSLLPGAVVPWIMERVSAWVSAETVFQGAGLAMLIPLALTPLLAKAARGRAASRPAPPQPTLRQAWRGMTRRPVFTVLSCNLLLFLCYSTMFFFVKPFCQDTGVGDVGVFFATGITVAVFARLLLGPLLDKTDRRLMGAASLLCFGGAVAGLGLAQNSAVFYAMAGLYGLGFGLGSPLLSSLMFLVSDPGRRGFNMNMMLEAMDLGYLLGPALAGLAVHAGWSVPAVLGVSGLCAVAAALILPTLPRQAAPVEGAAS